MSIIVRTNGTNRVKSTSTPKIERKWQKQAGTGGCVLPLSILNIPSGLSTQDSRIDDIDAMVIVSGP